MPSTPKVYYDPKVSIRKRKKDKPLDSITKEVREEIVKDYMDSEPFPDLKAIATKYTLSQSAVSIIIRDHWEHLTNLREAILLKESTRYPDVHKSSSYLSLKKIQRSSKMNDEFLSLLSEDSSGLLSDEEIVFCQLMILSGNHETALEESGLAVGLLVPSTSATPEAKKGYRIALTLRASFLKLKPNVASFLTQLKSEKYFPDSIDKTSIQRELLHQLDVLNEDITMPLSNKQKLKLSVVEALGRTVGAFSDTLRIEKIDPAKALDYLDTLTSADAGIPLTEDPLELAVGSEYT
jgi:hypothetical protein